VSVSLRVKQDEGDLINLFRERISSNANYRVRVSLLDPNSPANDISAQSLNIPPGQLRNEIQEMLQHLVTFRDSLPEHCRPRFSILVHDSMPMGSAIMLDATPEAGTIQVETKLFRAPRLESFSYEVVGPSDFYSRNYRAWTAVIDQSSPVTIKALPPISEGLMHGDLELDLKLPRKNDRPLDGQKHD
jgi:hypothetical protein